jgi:transcriptional regulator with XRE-family HTH domain
MDKKRENQYVGANIRRFRVKSSMTEHQLAVAISKSHRRLTTESLKALERGDYRPSPYRVYYIARALGVNMEMLLE